jgi:hypothetical protein
MQAFLIGAGKPLAGQTAIGVAGARHNESGIALGFWGWAGRGLVWQLYGWRMELKLYVCGGTIWERGSLFDLRCTR